MTVPKLTPLTAFQKLSGGGGGGGGGAANPYTVRAAERQARLNKYKDEAAQRAMLNTANDPRVDPKERAGIMTMVGNDEIERQAREKRESEQAAQMAEARELQLRDVRRAQGAVTAKSMNKVWAPYLNAKTPQDRLAAYGTAYSETISGVKRKVYSKAVLDGLPTLKEAKQNFFRSATAGSPGIGPAGTPSGTEEADEAAAQFNDRVVGWMENMNTNLTFGDEPEPEKLEKLSTEDQSAVVEAATQFNAERQKTRADAIDTFGDSPNFSIASYDRDNPTVNPRSPSEMARFAQEHPELVLQAKERQRQQRISEKRAGRSSINVSTGGGAIAPTTAAKTRLQQTVDEADKQLGIIDRIDTTLRDNPTGEPDPENFLSRLAKLRTKATDVAAFWAPDFLDSIQSPEDKKLYQRALTLRNEVGRFSVTEIHELAGAQQQPAEVRRILPTLVNMDMNPTEFMAAIKGMKLRAEWAKDDSLTKLANGYKREGLNVSASVQDRRNKEFDVAFQRVANRKREDFVLQNNFATPKEMEAALLESGMVTDSTQAALETKRIGEMYFPPSE